MIDAVGCSPKLSKCSKTSERDEPAKPRGESVLLVGYACAAETVRNARDGEADGEEESRDAPAEGMRDPNERGVVADVVADAEVDPERAEEDLKRFVSRSFMRCLREPYSKLCPP